jgi:hypothetical protein
MKIEKLRIGKKKLLKSKNSKLHINHEKILDVEENVPLIEYDVIFKGCFLYQYDKTTLDILNEVEDDESKVQERIGKTNRENHILGRC